LESLPDPQRDALLALIQRVEELEQQVRALQANQPVADELAALT
jgi:hypothetical protein